MSNKWRRSAQPKVPAKKISRAAPGPQSKPRSTWESYFGVLAMRIFRRSVVKLTVASFVGRAMFASFIAGLVAGVLIKFFL